MLAVTVAGVAAWMTGVIGPAAPPQALQLANPVRVTGASGEERHPAWSRDGGLIAYAAAPPDGGPRDIYVAQVGSGEPVNRTADNAGNDFNPAWSPDGNQIAFTSNRDGSFGYYVMPALGGAAQRVFGAHALGNAQWSPGGREIAGVMVDDQGKLAIEIASIQTRQSRRVILEPIKAQVFDLRWSPDGRFLAFVEAVAKDAEAGQTLGSCASKIKSGIPCWTVGSPCGHRNDRVMAATLYFVSNREGSMDLWQLAVAADGAPTGEPSRVTNGVGMWDAALSARRQTAGLYPRQPGRQYLARADQRRIGPPPGPMRSSSPSTTRSSSSVSLSPGRAVTSAPIGPATRTCGSSRSAAARTGQPGKLRQLTTDPAPDWGTTTVAIGS